MSIKERRLRIPKRIRALGVGGIGSPSSSAQRNFLGGAELPDHSGKSLAGPGLFPDLDPKLPTGMPVEKVPTPVKKTFIRGSWFFATEFGRPPSTLNEARDWKAGQLVFDEELEIAPENLVPGKRKMGQAMHVRKEDLTHLLGAFVKVRIGVEDKDGNKNIGTYYVSLEDVSGLAERRLQKTGRAWRKTDILRAIS